MSERIIEELEAIGADLDWPDVPDLSVAVRLRIAESAEPAPAMRVSRWLPVAIAAALLVAAVLVIPGPREAVARFFGIAGVRVSGTSELPPSSTSGLQLGRRVPVAEAVKNAPFAVALPEDLPPPNTAFVGEPSSDAVTLVWAPSAELPPAGPAGGVGLLLTQFRGETAKPLLDKQIGPHATLEETEVGDEPAYWITGSPHLLTYLDPAGNRRDDTVRLAANTLLWSRDGVTYRLESALDRDVAIAIAESLR